MYPISGSSWLYKPWKLMAYGDNYRYYQYTDLKKHPNSSLFILIFRTSEKCYKVVWFSVSFHGFKTQIHYASYRSWTKVLVLAEGLAK